MAAGPVYACLPCPAGIDCPAGTKESDIAAGLAAQDTSLGVPVGTVVSLAVNRGTEFGGYLLCNGQDIPAGTKYNALRNLLGSTYGTGKVPNFQGYFLRGVGGNAAAVGSAQGDAIRNITGNITQQDDGRGSASGAFYKGEIWGKGTWDSSGSGSEQRYYFDASRSVPTAAENRPVNYSVYYYIKY
jgi:hypothetical protein